MLMSIAIIIMLFWYFQMNSTMKYKFTIVDVPSTCSTKYSWWKHFLRKMKVANMHIHDNAWSAHSENNLLEVSGKWIIYNLKCFVLKQTTPKSQILPCYRDEDVESKRTGQVNIGNNDHCYYTNISSNTNII